jgi:hypothetical protein
MYMTNVRQNKSCTLRNAEMSLLST